MKDSIILQHICRILYPFMLAFGLYIIIYGDKSPGGGFQGGVVLATAQLTRLFMFSGFRVDLENLGRIEKVLFSLILVAGMISIVTRGELLTNPFLPNHSWQRAYLVLLNLLIGLKVGSGLVVIFASFMEEDRHGD